MYLENSEQGKVSGEGELSTEAILAEKCVVPKVTEAAGLSSPSKANTELSIKVLVEYAEQSVGREMDPPLLCVEHDNMNTEETESRTHCSGQTFKEYATTNGFIESDQTLNDDTEGLNQLSDECTQRCECLKPSKSSELRVNHNLASESSTCCEHCPDHLLLFLKYEPSDQHSGSLEFEPEELEGNCGTLGESGMSVFMPECRDRLESLQHELSDQDSFDSEQDGSTEDSERSFTENISGSVDSLNCAEELCECVESQTQTEHTDDDGDEEDVSHEAVQNEEEFSDKQGTTDFTDVPFESDVGVMHLLTQEEIFQQTSEIDASELSRNDDSDYEDECEPTQRCHSGYSIGFCPEEDGSSEGSSVETKSFKTCLDDSCLSDLCSDSEESDKGAQEDSSDEPMQWESLEDIKKENHNFNFNRNDDKQKKTPTVNVTEDLFDLFDSADCYGHLFAQTRHYISCFDGGDIHDRLHLEEEVQRCRNKTVYKLDDKEEEIGEHDNGKCSIEEAELSRHNYNVDSEDTSELNVHEDDVDSGDDSELNEHDDDVDSEDTSELNVHEDDVDSEDVSELNVHDDDVDSEDASELNVHDDDVDSEDTSELNVHDDDVDSEDTSELNEHDDDVDSEDVSELNEHEDDVDSEDVSELNVHDDDVDSEDAALDTDEEDSSQRDESYDSEIQSDDWTIRSESILTKDDSEEKDSEMLYKENNEEAKYVEASVIDDAFVPEGHISDARGKELKVCLHSGDGENMFAPYAQEISVEGDAYEDEVSASKNRDSPGNATLTDDTEMSSDLKEDETDKPDPEHDFLACSEMEPYWALIDQGNSEEFCEPDLEDYYRYQIKSIRFSGQPDLNGFIMNKYSSQQKSDENPDDNTSHNENKGLVSSLGETESQDMEVCSEESKSVGFGITVVEKTQNEQCENECELDELSAEISLPLDIIHSVVSKPTNETTQTTDSDEEQSDDESIELCECEYCIPPTQQVPVKPLLSQGTSDDLGKICVVIDLDETLVHSSFKPLNNADFIIPVEIEGTLHQVYVLKRPHVDEFLKRMGELFECVLFTASLSKYADPVSDLLDKCGAFQSRLFREACVFHKGNYVKDLSRLGRDLHKVIIIDNSPASYIFHPDNAVPVVSWFDDKSDTELLDLLPFFERLSRADDIYDILKEQRTSS